MATARKSKKEKLHGVVKRTNQADVSHPYRAFLRFLWLLFWLRLAATLGSPRLRGSTTSARKFT